MVIVTSAAGVEFDGDEGEEEPQPAAIPRLTSVNVRIETRLMTADCPMRPPEPVKPARRIPALPGHGDPPTGPVSPTCPTCPTRPTRPICPTRPISAARRP